MCTSLLSYIIFLSFKWRSFTILQIWTESDCLEQQNKLLNDSDGSVNDDQDSEKKKKKLVRII